MVEAQPVSRLARALDDAGGVGDGFQVDDHRVAAGLCELLGLIERVGDHQMAFQRQRGHGAQRLDHDGADRDRRHEMPVHDIDVQQIGVLLDARDLLAQLGEVGGKDGGGQPVAWHRPRW